jgi:hypothetical protein
MGTITWELSSKASKAVQPLFQRDQLARHSVVVDRSESSALPEEVGSTASIKT